MLVEVPVAAVATEGGGCGGGGSGAKPAPEVEVGILGRLKLGGGGRLCFLLALLEFRRFWGSGSGKKMLKFQDAFRRSFWTLLGDF